MCSHSDEKISETSFPADFPSDKKTAPDLSPLLAEAQRIIGQNHLGFWLDGAEVAAFIELLLAIGEMLLHLRSAVDLMIPLSALRWKAEDNREGFMLHAEDIRHIDDALIRLQRMNDF